MDTHIPLTSSHTDHLGIDGLSSRRWTSAPVPDLAVFRIAARLSHLFVAFREAQISHVQRTGLTDPVGAVIEIDGDGEAVWHGMLMASVRRENYRPYNGAPHLLISVYDEGRGVCPLIPARKSSSADHNAPPDLAALAAEIDEMLANAREIIPHIAIETSSSVQWMIDQAPVHCTVEAHPDVAEGSPYLIIRSAAASGSTTPRFPAPTFGRRGA